VAPVNDFSIPTWFQPHTQPFAERSNYSRYRDTYTSWTRLEPTVNDITFVPALTYRDPRAALAWLAEAFGFETTMAIEAPGDDMSNNHYEMGVGGRGRIMVGAEWADWTRSPASVSGYNTTTVHVSVESGIDAHCERARAAGAAILREPVDEWYGDRVYRCADPEGHHWSFSQHVRDVTLDEAAAASGTTIVATNWP